MLKTFNDVYERIQGRPVKKEEVVRELLHLSHNNSVIWQVANVVYANHPKCPHCEGSSSMAIVLADHFEEFVLLLACALNDHTKQLTDTLLDEANRQSNFKVILHKQI